MDLMQGLIHVWAAEFSKISQGSGSIYEVKGR